MIEFLESLPLLPQPWFLPAAGTVAVVELLAAVALVCVKRAVRRQRPLGQRPVSQTSNIGTRAIRRLRNGQ